jgi:3-deoxy-D-manno-octulosonic-acid transferase
MRLFYWLLTWVALFVLAPLLLLSKKTRDGWAQRLGWYASTPAPGGHPRIWLHGASAGDLLALSPMIQRLKLQWPGAKIILSTMTNSGAAIGQGRLLGSVDTVIYVPWDTLGATRRAAAAIRPDLLVLEYTEMWPNLIRAAKNVGAKVVLTNGRFASRRLRWYRWFLVAIGNPLHDVDLFLMREQDEADRAIYLGADSRRVQVTGNTKFDALKGTATVGNGALEEAFGVKPGERIWIAGSTHEDEEGDLLEVFLGLRPTVPELRFIIAPRYVDRANKIVSLAQAKRLKVRKRSEADSGRWDVLVLDTIGELTEAYRMATVVFVGGSLPCTQRGGQNILEPAAQGRPVLFGPNMQNFHDSVQVLVGRGGIQVNDTRHLLRVMLELFEKPEALDQLGQMARQTVEQISGASDRNVAAMRSLLTQMRASS